MKITAHLGFVVGVLVTSVLLCLAPLDESRVAMLRLDSLLRQQTGLKEEISRHCSALTARDNSEVTAFFLERLAPVAPHAEFRPCVLMVESAHGERFHLRSYWNFLLHIQATTPVVERHFNVEFPRPLCFLPIAFFLWALLVGEAFWGLWLTLGTYVFILGGLNLTRTVQLAFSSGVLALTSDTTALGLALVTLWLALWLEMARYRAESPSPPGRAPSPLDVAARHLGTFFIGIWNPLVYTIAGRALFPLRGTLSRLRPFLDTQLLITCLSLFILSADFSHHQGWLENSVLLPRYFSCAALTFIVFRYTMVRPDRTKLALELPPFWRGVAFVLVIELIAWRVAWLGEFPRLIRIGSGLVLSEILFYRRQNIRRALHAFLPWFSAIFIAAFFTAVSRKGGATDMAVTLLTPQSSPDTLVFTTFLAGLGIGFLTGNFSLSFFALFPTLLRGHESNIMRAALLDGILAGNLLSPFSLFNLLPAAQFDLGLGKLVKFRLRQILAPLLIGGSIYAVSSLNSIAILQPVTFVFLCLVAFTFQMRESRWHLVRFFQ